MMKTNVIAECFNNPNAIPFERKFEVILPDECPNCHSAWQPICLHSTYIQNESFIKESDDSYETSCDVDDFINELNVFMICSKCLSTAVAVYEFNDFEFDIHTLKYDRLFPQTIKPKQFSKHIQSICSKFPEIYNQAATAEMYGLTEIAGVGYRRAFEFLIKDYAILKNPDAKEEIKNFELVKCVNDYIKTPDIVDLAKRAAWLGNDQTHYINKHPNLDLNDLKDVIDISLHFIEMEMKAAEARTRITNANSKR